MTHGIAGRGRALSLSLVCTAVMSAGCDDALAPGDRFDPRITLDRLQEILAPLEDGGDFLLALDLAVVTLEFHGGARMAQAVSLRPERGGQLLRSVRGARRSGSVSSEAAQLDAGIESFTIPRRLAGETLEWDRVEGYVVSGRAGAPSSGVRFLLYRMDGDTGYPAMPLSPMGYLDLIDDDGGLEEAVRVRAVRTTGSDRVIADYRVSLTGSGSYDEGVMEVRLRGALGAAASVDLDLSQRLAWSRRNDRDELRLNYEYRRGTASTVLEGRAESRYEGLEWESFDFVVAVRGAGARTEIDATIRSDASLRGEIRSAERRVVWIGGYDGRPTFEGVAGIRLDGSDRSALEQVWVGITDLLWLTDWALVPADLLVSGG